MNLPSTVLSSVERAPCPPWGDDGQPNVVNVLQALRQDLRGDNRPSKTGSDDPWCRVINRGIHPLARPAKEEPSAWEIAVLHPGDEGWERLAQAMVPRWRSLGDEGKRSVIAGWADDRWGLSRLWRAGAAPEHRAWSAERLLRLVALLNDWLLGAPGLFPVHDVPFWAPPGQGTTHALGRGEFGHPMQHFQVRALLHTLLKTGDDAAWAVPVLAKSVWWDRSTSWWWLPLRDEHRGERSWSLVERARSEGAWRLADAVIEAEL